MQSESNDSRVPKRNGRASLQGIEVRHQNRCATNAGGRRCTCAPSYRAVVVLERPGGQRHRLSKTFATPAQAQSWRREAMVAVENGRLRTSTPVAFRDAADKYLDGARSGTIRNRSGHAYKPSAVRGIEQAFRLRLTPAFGARRLADVRRADLQRLIDRMQAEGLCASTIRNTINAARALYRYAARLDLVASDPTDGLALPAVRSRRERIASPEEAEALLAALDDQDRALWGTALYAGLRLGELRALRWEAVDLAGGIIRVESSWDAKAGPVEPKSRRSRKVPVAPVLRDLLIEHRVSHSTGDGLVFGKTAERPFDPSTIEGRARRAWKAAKLTLIRTHECRHTCASFMIFAGVNAKALSTYMGHASIATTYDLYGHLLPGDESTAARLLDGFLSRSAVAAQGQDASASDNVVGALE